MKFVDYYGKELSLQNTFSKEEIDIAKEYPDLIIDANQYGASREKIGKNKFKIYGQAGYRFNGVKLSGYESINDLVVEFNSMYDMDLKIIYTLYDNNTIDYEIIYKKNITCAGCSLCIYIKDFKLSQIEDNAIFDLKIHNYNSDSVTYENPLYVSIYRHSSKPIDVFMKTELK